MHTDRTLGVYIGNLDEDWGRFIDNWDNVDLDAFSTPLTVFSERIKREAEHDEQLLLNDYRKLNTEGQKEAKKRVQELTEIKRYTEIEED